MIIEYKLDSGPQGMVCPSWVKDGGYYRDPDDFTMVGWTNDAPREFKIPDSVIVLDKAALTTRVINIHSRYPFPKINDEGEIEGNMTTEEITAQVSTWYDSW